MVNTNTPYTVEYWNNIAKNFVQLSTGKRDENIVYAKAIDGILVQVGRPTIISGRYSIGMEYFENENVINYSLAGYTVTTVNKQVISR